MKSFLSSKTIIGALISILSKIYGVKTGDASNAYDLTLVLWPIILGMIADFSGVIARVKQTEFDVTVFQRPAFWAAVGSGVATIISAFGYNIDGLHNIVHKAMDNSRAFIALAGSIWSIIGAIRATKPISLN